MDCCTLKVTAIFQYSVSCIKLFILFSLFICDSKCASVSEKCQSCRLLVATFNNGLKETVKAHFGGGNTAWETERLGKYKTSETRLVEILESVCSKKDNFKGITGELFKDVTHQCHALLEEQEHHIENWYFHKQKSDPAMLDWLCINTLKLCCNFGFYGKECMPCAGETPCSGRGTCHGNGTREGSGKCTCETGYQGKMCRQCATGYFPAHTTELNCQRCDSSCKGDCTSSGPAGCIACKEGWRMREEHGCADIDECQEDEPCKGRNEECSNTIGSYDCVCRPGFKRHSLLCIEDIAAPSEINDTDSKDATDQLDNLNENVQSEPNKTEL